MFKEPMLITKYFYLQSWTNFGIYNSTFMSFGLQVQINVGTHVTVSNLHHGKTLQIWKKDLIVPSNCKSVVMKIKAISRHNYSFFALPVMCLPFLIRLIYHTRTILPASLMRRSLSSSSQNLVRTFALVWLQIWGSVELKVTNLIYEIFFLKVFLRLYRLCLDFFATMSLLFVERSNIQSTTTSVQLWVP